MSSTATTIVACNIYITASASHKSTLLRLLRTAQEQCDKLRRTSSRTLSNHWRSVGGGTKGTVPSSPSPVGVVHAYADIPYNRSSFHFAGCSDCVTAVACELLRSAIQDIDIADVVAGRTENDILFCHPFVGLVDHVSVMPLTHTSLTATKHPHYSTDTTAAHNNGKVAAAAVAREIGKQIDDTGLVTVHYYGLACPHTTPLAVVRRERTSFFHSSRGATDRRTNNHNRHPPQTNYYGSGGASVAAANANIGITNGNTTIVGTPIQFVENFNIRLTSNVSYEQAKTLTQFLRGRKNTYNDTEHGVVGVEALTLAYNDVRKYQLPQDQKIVYEVACNLTNPQEGSVDRIVDQLGRWIRSQRSTRHSLLMEVDDEYKYFVEDAYRVGTTEEQCIQMLYQGNATTTVSIGDEVWKEHDNDVYCTFDKLLSS